MKWWKWCLRREKHQDGTLERDPAVNHTDISGSSSVNLMDLLSNVTEAELYHNSMKAYGNSQRREINKMSFQMEIS